MRCGRFMGFGYNGSVVLTIVLIFTVILFYFLLKKKGKTDNSMFLEILKNRYLKSEINAEEYKEMKNIIEDEDFDDSAVLILKGRFAKGEINSKEFYVILNNLMDGKKEIDILKEKYANGDISSEDFLQRKKDTK